MRAFKASKKNRTTFNYYSVTGEKIEITPDEVGTTWIARLHGEDDAMVDADRRQAYLAPVHYDSLANAEGDSEGTEEERLGFLADPDLSPLSRIIESFEEQEKRTVMLRLKEAIKKLQPQQIDLIYQSFYARRTNVEIAKAQGVTEAAIRNRLKKIYARLGKLMTDPAT